MHLQIGRRLTALSQVSSGIKDPGREEWLLLAASNMVRGAKYIDTDDERIATMQLLLNAATAAVSKASIHNARMYVQCAVAMMKESDCDTNCELCIDLQNTYAEVSYCTGHFADSDKAIESVLRDATNEKDRFRAKCTKMNSLIFQKSHGRLLDWVFNVVLRDLGVRIPPRPSPVSVLRELIRLQIALRKIKYRDFLSMPKMVDERKLAVLQVLNSVTPVLFDSPSKVLYLFCTLRQIRLSVKYGISAFTSAALATGAMLLGAMNKIEEMYELGNVSVEISSREGYSPSSRSMWWVQGLDVVCLRVSCHCCSEAPSLELFKRHRGANVLHKKETRCITRIRVVKRLVF
jgi:predicted ATPase